MHKEALGLLARSGLFLCFGHANVCAYTSQHTWFQLLKVMSHQAFPIQFLFHIAHGLSNQAP